MTFIPSHTFVPRCARIANVALEKQNNAVIAVKAARKHPGVACD